MGSVLRSSASTSFNIVALLSIFTQACFSLRFLNDEVDLNNFSVEACEALHSCKDIVSNHEVCVFNYIDGSYVTLPNKCTMFKNNCERKTAFFELEMVACKPGKKLDEKISRDHSSSTKVAENARAYSCSNFSRYCTSSKRPSMQLQNVCAFDFHKAHYVSFDSICDMWSKSCNNNLMYFAVSETYCHAELRIKENGINKDIISTLACKTSFAGQCLFSAETQCDVWKTCITILNPGKACARNILNDTFYLFENICLAAKYNCHGKGQFVHISEDHCNHLSSHTQVAQEIHVTLLEDYAKLVRLHCAKIDKCVDDNEQICAQNYTIDDSVYNVTALFKNQCSWHLLSCQRNSYFQKIDMKYCENVKYNDNHLLSYEAQSMRVDGLFTENTQEIQDIECKKYKKDCARRNMISVSYICAQNIENGLLRLFTSECFMYEANCESKQVFREAEMVHCITQNRNTISLSNSHKNNIMNRTIFVHTACESAEKCEVTENDAPVCTIGLDGKNVKFLNKCKLLKANCQQKGVYLITASNQCDELPITSNDYTKLANENELLDWTAIMEPFSKRACTSCEKCLTEENTEEVCAINFNNGTYVKFNSKCQMLEYNCLKKGIMLQVDTVKCNRNLH